MRQELTALLESLMLKKRQEDFGFDSSNGFDKGYNNAVSEINQQINEALK